MGRTFTLSVELPGGGLSEFFITKNDNAASLRDSMRDLTGDEIVSFVVGNNNICFDAVVEGAKDLRNTGVELDLPPTGVSWVDEEDEEAMKYSVKV